MPPGDERYASDEPSPAMPAGYGHIRYTADTNMDASLVLANAGALITTGLGGLGLFLPDRAAAFTSMSPVGENGRSEIRATYGGLFAAMGLACLASQWYPIYLTVGIAWFGAGVGRVWSVIVDRNFDRKNLGGIVMEFGIALLFLAPRLSAV